MTKQWAHVEIVGSRDHWGEVSEIGYGGGTLVRIEVPTHLGTTLVHDYGISAIFAIHPCTRDDVMRRLGCPDGVDEDAIELDAEDLCSPWDDDDESVSEELVPDPSPDEDEEDPDDELDAAHGYQVMRPHRAAVAIASPVDALIESSAFGGWWRR